MRRLILTMVAVALALLLQLTTINGLRLPGGGIPDLVLLVVAALGLAGGPARGAIIGFAAGLGLDLAPPGSGLLGQYALVLCLVGWTCGRFRGILARSAAVPMMIVAAAAVAGEVMIAALGLALQPAQVSWTSVRQVLPPGAFYDVVASPFVLYLVLLAGAWLGEAATADSGARAGQARFLAGGALVGPAGLGGPAALAGTQGVAPRPGLAASAGPAGGGMPLGLGGWLAGPPESRRARRAAARRAPKLAPGAGRLGDGWVGGSAAGRARSGQVVGGPALSGQAWRGQALRGQAFSGQALRNLARDRRPHGSGAALRAGVAGSAAGPHAPRTLAARPVHLRLAAGRKGDGTVGNMLGGGRSVVAGRAPRRRSLNRNSLGGGSLGRGSLGRGALGRGALGPVSLDGGALSRRSMDRLGRRRPSRGGSFRPAVMPGGSAVTSAVTPQQASGHSGSAAPPRSGTARLGTARSGTARFGTARFGTARFGTARFVPGRRRDGLIGGGVLSPLGRSGGIGRSGGSGRRMAAPRFRVRPGGSAHLTTSGLTGTSGPGAGTLPSLRRPAPQRLRMHPRRGDGMLGGSLGGRGRPLGGRGRSLGGLRTTAGLRGGRPATPRFRARPLSTGRPPSGKRPRFGYRRWSVRSLLPGRFGARWPARRTVGLRAGSTGPSGSLTHRSWAHRRWAAIRRTGGLR